MPGPPITYTGSGTEPLRSNPTTKASPPAAQNRNPGKPAGGTEDLGTRTMTLAAKAMKLTTKGDGKHPEQVRTFKDASV